MPSDFANQNKNQHSFDPEYQTENIAFDPEKMIKCKGCERQNPPNRIKCIYCGGELDVSIKGSASIKTNLRKLELWEKGHNVILRESIPENFDTNKIAPLLSIDATDVKMITGSRCPLPLARVESETEASIILVGLRTLGLNCSIVHDEDLSADEPPVRLSKIAILENSFALTNFNTGEVTKITLDDLALIVPGILLSGKVDSLEKKRRGKEPKLLGETITTDDELILDIYTRQSATGFRIRMTGFDFSCLGEEKRLLATENIKSLAHKLKAVSTKARLVADYSEVRQALGLIWEIESRKDSKGLQRIGFGKKEFRAVASTNNLNQFTKYSRLQWHLL
jgi:hypothetical protein